ncbi:electron transport complex subunit RsxC [Thiofilum flexile]|uniref:electron transport complex subunit RsxC n=1 Tax=Thiofilum flexile TaxID=125627 RepID=UPI0003672DA8|nr:electron transport complex subunit RsxC [Thiofilum flexile]
MSIWALPAGLKLADYHKTASSQHTTQTLIPQQGERFIIPLQQHTGTKPHLEVVVGQYVYKGQILARPQDKISAAIHASTSGVILAIEPHTIAHTSGLPDLCVVIEADGLEDWGNSRFPSLDYSHTDLATLVTRVRDCGVVGLGGAVFPTDIKLNVPQPIPTLILNGAECEPYITCDDRLMQEHADEIVAGAKIIMHMLQAQVCKIGIEDNKPAAIAVMQQAVETAQLPSIEVVTIPTIYPSGAKKQLTYILTGKEVPSGGRGGDAGALCVNVGTARAVYQAVVKGEPLISRYVTISGDAIKQAGNFDVPFGLPIQRLVDAAQGATVTNPVLSMGGSMMPLPLHSSTTPVVKATNCVLVRTPPKPETIMPCIRCGHCAEVCPVNLLPQQLYWHARAKDLEQTERYHLFDCIECGCCSYVCPSHIPLVDYYRFAKAEIKTQRETRQKAEIARSRHEFRQERLERAQREKAEKLTKHKTTLQDSAAQTSSTSPEMDAKKAAIQAALERAKAKKAQQAATETSPIPENKA